MELSIDLNFGRWRLSEKMAFREMTGGFNVEAVWSRWLNAWGDTFADNPTEAQLAKREVPEEVLNFPEDHILALAVVVAQRDDPSITLSQLADQFTSDQLMDALVAATEEFVAANPTSPPNRAARRTKAPAKKTTSGPRSSSATSSAGH